MYKSIAVSLIVGLHLAADAIFLLNIRTRKPNLQLATEAVPIPVIRDKAKEFFSSFTNEDKVHIYQKGRVYLDYDVLEVSLKKTVREAKEIILQAPDRFYTVAGLPVDDFVLQFDTRTLDDMVTLEDAGVKNQSYLFLKKKADIP